MLDRIKMAKSTFYYHQKRINQPDGYDDLRHRIDVIYHHHNGRYGYRRITAQLHNDGVNVNHKTVQKLMCQMNLKGRRMKMHYHSYKGVVGKIAGNVIDRNFEAYRPNQKWTTDVTQVCIRGRKLYLSPILDMFNGEIIAYATSCNPDMSLITTMIKKAFRKHKNVDGLVFHSDQGWQYQHLAYQELLQKKGIVQSMSRKGNCLDNAIMENFFGLMKTELLYTREWKSIKQFERELKEYIKYYNNQRIKLKLHGKSPVQYRTLCC